MCELFIAWTSRNTSNFISTSYNPLSRFPRKAKEKLNYVFHNDDSDHEFINIDVTINKGKQQTNTTDNKDKKAEKKAILIEPLPQKKEHRNVQQIGWKKALKQLSIMKVKEPNHQGNE